MSKRILITGAGSGIGEGVAKLLAAAGHQVIATDVRIEPVQNWLQESGAANITAASMDVTNEAAVLDVVKNFGPIDVLINNAGIQHVAPLEEFPQERWSLLVDIMLNGVARTTRAVLPGMRERGFGRIVNIGSIHSLVASPFKSAYVAAKHGLVGFSKVVALETADTDITINTVCPTYVQTPLVQNQIAATAKQYQMSEADVVSEIMLKPMPKGVFISLEELAGIAQFLISDIARNITGQTIVVDGGWTAR
ncbi:3-hydroxybutyrate dehydrogenase [Permianibacter aggregans]|uniref:3-hydroxybutyrate dehydrogenase n=1 Tax=Permianibacter aggregans TaxID=1510150 RepID=A0A4R6V5D6_9GAMM|nr:3-hydroxybutyrate dehydrogenase [Permianibacter aggregans]QGX41589.1 3-hydroxybutyrate dehydrogenase [Permianibacter aggregans]TDQ51394.1 3-hydroxybutyrate dehydrogenase [Permianibacter aggregans]